MAWLPVPSVLRAGAGRFRSTTLSMATTSRWTTMAMGRTSQASLQVSRAL